MPISKYTSFTHKYMDVHSFSPLQMVAYFSTPCCFPPITRCLGDTSVHQVAIVTCSLTLVLLYLLMILVWLFWQLSVQTGTGEGWRILASHPALVPTQVRVRAVPGLPSRGRHHFILKTTKGVLKGTWLS